MTPSIRAAASLAPEAYAAFRRRAIFEGGKWDPQVGDQPALAPFPLCLSPATWRELARAAEALAGEAQEAERELLGRPALHRRLGLPRGVRGPLREVSRHGPSRGAARFLRFDFHPTRDGWRISEVNSDVPGGFVEASRITSLVAEHHPGWRPTGDPAAALAEAVLAEVGSGALVALVHATAYVDDHQVMACLGRALHRRGLETALVSPTHLRWRDGRAQIPTEGATRDVALVLRFFPAEWLVGAPSACGWLHFFRGASTPLGNPGHSLLSQSKRLPLLFGELSTPLPTWRERLPESRDPRDAPWRTDEGWVLKPALGRVGEGVGIRGVTDAKAWRRIARSARWFPGAWVAQRRFESVPLSTPEAPLHACVGVFTVDGRVAGAYGRVARKPLVDGDAADAAVLVPEEEDVT